MKLKNGLTYLERGNEDNKFFERMKEMLKKHFKLELEDLPEVLRKIGIAGDEYELSEFKLEFDSEISFYVKTQLESVIVEFMVGDMINPHSKVKVIKENKSEKAYYISRVIEVQSENEIMEELKKVSKRDRRKGRKLYKELMKK